MVVSGFDPYHRLWQGITPTKHIDVIPTPWAMLLALGFCTILLGDEWHGYHHHLEKGFFIWHSNDFSYFLLRRHFLA
jgi:hypothetical protein